ncbi:hypothetical protein D3C84_1056490 [compost metagenome]
MVIFSGVIITGFSSSLTVIIKEFVAVLQASVAVQLTVVSPLLKTLFANEPVPLAVVAPVSI